MGFHLDSIDKKIIQCLIKDARIKVVDVAQSIGVTSAAIHQRIGKIKRSGIIKQFTTFLDVRKLGYATTAFVGVFLDKNSSYQKVLEKLEGINEVVEVHYTTGKYGLFIKLYTRDNDHLMSVLNGEIQKIKEITSTETFISLEESLSRSVSL